MSSRRPSKPTATRTVGACPSCGAGFLRGNRFCPNCGSDHSADATADVLAQAEEAALQAVLREITLGEYEILGILGRGGMGLVYLAHDISLNKKVAIKVLPPALLRGDAAVERFRREARIAASLRHRHITSVFALKETSTLLYFVMEYVEGRALDAILRDEKRLPLDVAQAILVDAAGALSYAHRREVVHRDLKPANVMVDEEGMAMIADFGVAKVRTVDGLTASGSTVGSPKYMSPEQWSGTATSLSDQYGLGCVVYETLAGRAPFEGETIESLLKQLVLDVPRPLSELRPDCPPPMAAAVMRMLAKVPAQRWPNLDAAVAAMGLHPVSPDDPVRLRLAQLAKRGHDVRPFPKTPRSPIPALRGGPRTRRPDRRESRRRSIKHGLVWLAAAVMLAAIAIGVYMIGPPPPPVLPAPRLVAGIKITDAPATLAPGARARLTGRAVDSSGIGVDTASVVWSSNDASIVSVSLDGWVTALAPGKATVTASSGDKHASVSVTVSPRTIAVLQVTPREARITTGETVRLSAHRRDDQGQAVDNRSIYWTSSAPGIVTVSSFGDARGVNPGTATVTAVSSGQRATVTIVVTKMPATALEVRPAGVRVAVGQAVQLSVWARDARGGALGQRSALWTTSNADVATVSVNGVVSGLVPGTATITARSADLSAAATVEVFAVKPPSPGVLQMLVTPWANLTVDEVFRGQRTRGADTLSAGVPHRLRFERPGFATIDTTITLQPGEQRLLRVQMTRSGP